MGRLVEGKWVDEWYDTEKTKGAFIRSLSQFRSCIGEDGLAAEENRYHLYVSAACPWAHRTLMVRVLKGLQHIITVSAVRPLMLENGWEFGESHPDHLYDSRFLHELYTKADPRYSGRVTVPLLWDKKNHRAVNNESPELLRMFNSAFNTLTGNPYDLYPEMVRKEIDTMNARVYEAVNNGVYRAGFATSQEAYDEATQLLFSALDELESHLAQHDFLVGGLLTEADFRLLPTLLRFDAVYTTHFKCDRKRLVDHHHLFNYTKQLIQIPGLFATFDLDAVRKHYFGSHLTINPHGIISVGPRVDFSAPHDRKRDALSSIAQRIE